MTSDKYAQLGASASKSGLHTALDSVGANSDAPYFAQLAKDLAGDAN